LGSPFLFQETENIVMTTDLILHQGGWEASLSDLASVPVPEETESYFPVPYGRFVEEVALHVPRFGLTIERQEFALARDGNQMFGVLTCSNGHGAKDYGLAIGLRNSYDRSLSVGLVVGHRVFCCDNLAFSGEIAMARKHTVNVFRDLPDLIYRMLSRVSTLHERMDAEIGAMKAQELDDRDAHHLMVEAIRAQVVPASQLPKVLNVWRHPIHEDFRPRTSWSLFNTFSELVKSRSPRAQMDGTLRLTDVFRQTLNLGNGNEKPITEAGVS
jgi:hypothetical protein